MEFMDFQASMEIAQDRDKVMNRSDLDTGRARGDSMITMVDSVTDHGINHQHNNAMVTIVKGFDHHHDED